MLRNITTYIFLYCLISAKSSFSVCFAFPPFVSLSLSLSTSHSFPVSLFLSLPFRHMSTHTHLHTHNYLRIQIMKCRYFAHKIILIFFWVDLHVPKSVHILLLEPKGLWYVIFKPMEHFPTNMETFRFEMPLFYYWINKWCPEFIFIIYVCVCMYVHTHTHIYIYICTCITNLERESGREEGRRERDREKREKHQFVVSLINVFTG